MADEQTPCPRGEDCWQCRKLTPEELEAASKYWANYQEMLEALEAKK